MGMRSRACTVVAAVTAGAAVSLGAQTPTFREVTGHGFGERITQHHQMERYLQRLAETSDRVRLVRQGESWEGRGLWVAIVTAPENHARLEAIRAASLRLADPRATRPDEIARLPGDQPVVMWFGGSIHGFELSGSEGALKLLEHLTTRSDEGTLAALRGAVVLVDPMLNPDGRDAFAHLNHERIGRRPSSNRDDWSNDFTAWQPLQFRTGHYYFDNNRDWFAQTQPETRHRVAFLRQWAPQVAVDMHEMGPDAEFYFDPPGDPTNPHFPSFASRWFRTFGEAYAAAFDSAGFEYMTRERYNYFYPGYTSHRGYQGAVAMLFEQGSTRGLVLTRGDQSVRGLADAVEQQYLAAWTAVRTAVAGRDRLLREYHESQRGLVTGADVGSAATSRRFLIDPAQGDPGLVRELVTLLERNGIEVGVLEAPARLTGVVDRAGRPAGARDFPAGAYVVDTQQPAGRLARTLLAPDTPQPEAFLRRARAYVERAENPRFYDITAWSLPLLFNLGVHGTNDSRVLPAPAVPAAPAVLGQEGRRAGGQYALLLDGANVYTVAALHRLLDEGVRVGVLTASSRIAGRPVAGGAGIVRLGQNDSSAAGAVDRVAAEFGITVTAVPTGLSDSGFPALGSGDHTFNLRPTSVALLAEDGIQGYSFGWNWYTLDRQYQLPVTVLRTRAVRGLKLERYDAIVLPEANADPLREALGDEGLDRLERWVRDGGTLVAIGAAVEFARRHFELGLRSWYDTAPGSTAQRFDVPGAVFQAELDLRHWASAGYRAAPLPVLVSSSRIYLDPVGPPSAERRVIARYAAASPKLAGHAWPESLERLPGAVYAYEERVGRGRVIAFAEEVSFRAFARGTNRLFLNAVVLGPSAP
jgi:Zinc carboxypeptidase